MPTRRGRLLNVRSVCGEIDRGPDSPYYDVNMAGPYWLTVKRARMSTERLLKTLAILHPPVDVFDVARRLQINVRVENGLQVAGEVDSSSSSATVRIRGTDGYRRQRFTLAHEIGHLILHPLGRLWRDDSYIGSSMDDRATEAQANGYAAGLLMPLWMLEPVVMRGKPSVRSLSDLFEVSEAAMSIRVGRLLGGRPEEWSTVGW